MSHGPKEHLPTSGELPADTVRELLDATSTIARIAVNMPDQRQAPPVLYHESVPAQPSARLWRRAAALKEETLSDASEPQPEKRSRLFRYGWYARRPISIVLAAGVAYGGADVLASHRDEATCTDAQVSVRVGESHLPVAAQIVAAKDAVAGLLSHSTPSLREVVAAQPLYRPVLEVAAKNANHKAMPEHAGKPQVDQPLKRIVGGVACIELTTPVVAGEQVVGVTAPIEPLALFAVHQGMTPTRFKKLNPTFKRLDNRDELPADTRVRVASKLDDSMLLTRTGLSAQTVAGRVAGGWNSLHADIANSIQTAIIAANASQLSSGGALKGVYFAPSEFTTPPEAVTPASVRPESPAEQSSLSQLLLGGVPENYAKLYVAYGKQYDVSPTLLAAQGRIESNYDPRAVSVVGAKGVSQFMDGTFRDYKAKLKFPAGVTAFDARYAIEAQAAMMADLFKSADAFLAKHPGVTDNRETVALSMYNAGSGRVNQLGKVLNVTRPYIKNIKDRQRAIEQEPVVAIESLTHRTEKGKLVPEKIDGKIYYNQGDVRWGSKPFGNRANETGADIADQGCGATAVAMVVANLMGKEQDPSAIARAMAQQGLIDEQAIATKHQAFTDIPRAFGLNTEQLGADVNLARIKEITGAGGLIFVNGHDNDLRTPATQSGHIMVIRGVKDGKLLILDPASAGNSLLSWKRSDIFVSSTSDTAVVAVTKPR